MSALSRLDTAKERDIRAVAAAMGVTLSKDGKQAYCIHSRGPGKGTPSISFFRAKDGRLKFACHSCGAGGDTIDLVELFQSCDRSEALTYLSGELPKVEQVWADVDAETVIPYPERVTACEAFYRECATLDVTAARWLEDERGIDSLTAERFGLRVVTKDARTGGQSGERAFGAAIEATSAETALALGIAAQRESDKSLYPKLFGHWLVIPYRDLDGQIGHLQFRRLHRGDSKPKGPKYRHIHGTVPLPFNLAATQTEELAVGYVEGALDAIRVEALGLPCVGIPGTSWLNKPRAARLAERCGDRMCWVGFDADHERPRNANAEDSPMWSPGQQAQQRTALWMAEAGAEVQVTTWPADFLEDEQRNDWCDWLATNEGHPGLVPFVLPVEPIKGMADDESERALLRALLDGTIDADDVAIDGKAFTVESHGRAWDTLLGTWRREGHMDPTLLRSQLPDGLMESLPPTAPNGGRYLERVRDLYLRRTFLEAAARAVRSVEAGRSVEHARMMITAEEMPADGRDRQTMSESFRKWEAARYSNERRVVSTTIYELDQWLGGGFHMGLVNGVLAEKGTGKTTYLLTQVALSAAQAGLPVLRFSMELPETHMTAKDLSYLAKVPYGVLKPQATMGMRDEHARELAYWSQTLQDLPVWNVYGKLTMEQIREETRRHVRRFGIRLVVIDTFHSAKAGPKGPRSPIERYDRAGSIAHEMAQEFTQTAIVWLGQTGKGIATRNEHQPMLTDWKYQGEFVDQCRSMVGIYDPRKYEPESAMLGMMQFSPLKSSLGSGSQTDGVWMRADLDYQIFRPIGGGKDPFE